MQQGELTEIAAIASRDVAKADAAARQLNIPKAYGSYEELLADPEIDAIYNPLPNHLHVPWSIRPAEAGKHVLCEKPIALTAAEARELIAARDRTGMVIGEAFMIVCHPQWIRAMELAHNGSLGDLRAAIGSFGYFNPKPENVRNILDYGGGGLMDVGCYPIKAARMFFREEPIRISGTLVRDPNFRTDMLASGLLEFPSGHAIFTCGTQVVPNQTMKFLGAKASVEFDIPFNAIPGKTSRIRINDGSDLSGAGITVEEFPPCDQYTLQGDQFSRAILEHTPPPVPLEDAVKNMEVIEAVFRSAKAGDAYKSSG